MISDNPVNLASLVDYQADAVVSKTLVKKEKGTVTVFAFAAGQGLSEHAAPFDAIVQIIEGNAAVVIGGQDHRVRAGELILLPANIPHGLKAGAAFKMLLTMIRD